MKFSIVTPSYNYGRYLRAAANSVLSQSGADVEYLVHDACSTDETADVLRDLDHDRRVSVRIERDKGQTDAINRGFARATGDWLGWLNADEAYLPGALDAVQSFLRDNPDVDVVYGDTLFVDERTQRSWIRKDHSFEPDVLRYYGCHLASASTFFRTETARRVGPLDERLRVVMDYEYFLRLLDVGARFAYLPRPIGLFRLHGANISDVEADRRLRERHEVQLRYCGLAALPDAVRVPAFDVLKHVFTARRWIKKTRLHGLGGRGRAPAAPSAVP